MMLHLLADTAWLIQKSAQIITLDGQASCNYSLGLGWLPLSGNVFQKLSHIILVTGTGW